MGVQVLRRGSYTGSSPVYPIGVNVKTLGLVVLFCISYANCDPSMRLEGNNEKVIPKTDSEIVWINIKHAFGEDIPRPEVYIVCDSQKISCDSLKEDCRYWDTPYQRQYIRKMINVQCRCKNDIALLIRFFPEKLNWKKVEQGSLQFVIMRRNKEKEVRLLSRERSLLLVEEISNYLKGYDVADLKSFMVQFSDSTRKGGTVKSLK